jgi:hypothetical protein
MSTCFAYTDEARHALKDAKASKNAQERADALERGLEAMIKALATLNRDEETFLRNLARRHRGF